MPRLSQYEPLQPAATHKCELGPQCSKTVIIFGACVYTEQSPGQKKLLGVWGGFSLITGTQANSQDQAHLARVVWKEGEHAKELSSWARR